VPAIALEMVQVATPLASVVSVQVTALPWGR